MEERVNNRLRELSIPEFSKFMGEVKQAQNNIAKLKKKPLLSAFHLALVVSEEEEGLVNFMGRLLKEKGKQVDESVDTRSERKKRHKDETPNQRSMQKAIK